MSGVFGTDSPPVAMTQKRARRQVPRSVRTIQRSVSSSKVALATLVSNSMSLRRSSRSATNWA